MSINQNAPLCQASVVSQQTRVPLQDANLRQETRAALQESATLLRQNKKEEAASILHQSIRKPYQEGILSEGQMNAVYRSILPDPHAPETEFAKRQFQPLLILKAQALRDCVAHYSNISGDLYSNSAKSAILEAASLLEKEGDMEGAWKILNDVLPAQMRIDHPGISDEVVKEVYRIMNDSFRTPTSTFLKNRIKNNPQTIDDNRLRARALDSVSSHIFDPAVVEGNAPTFTVPAGFSLTVFANVLGHNVLPHSEPKELSAVQRTSKSLKQAVIESIKIRREATWKELREWRQMGIELNKDTLASLRIIRGEGSEGVTDKELESILPHCPKLEVLDLGSNEKITKRCLRVISAYCPNLLSFNLSNGHGLLSSSLTLLELTYGLTKLQHLGLKNCWLGKKDIEAIANWCPDLRSIDLSGNSLEDSDIQTLVKGCKNLTHFTASGNRQFGDDTLRALACCPHLTSARFSGCQTRDGANRFTQEGMKAFVKGCRNLTDLEFQNCSLPDNVLHVIGEARLPLRRLNFSYNNNGNYTPAAVAALIQGCPQLEEAHLMLGQGLQDVVLESLAKHCPLLSHLNISYQNDISLGLHSVAQGCTHLKQLRMKDNTRAGFQDILPILTDSRSRLTSIDFDGTLNATSEEIIAFVKRHPDLTHINLSSREVTDEVLIAIAENCPKLQSIEGITHATSTGIAALGKGCPLITKLGMKRNQHLGDAMLKAIGENFPELLDLDISEKWKTNAPTYSTDGLIVLSKGCTKLTHLNMESCNLALYSLKTVAKIFPRLKYINYAKSGCTSDSLITLFRTNCPGIKIRLTKTLRLNSYNNYDDTI